MNAITTTGNDSRYSHFLEVFRDHFLKMVDTNRKQVFTTDAEGLWETYLANLPEELRQHYTCNSCRHFVQRFGNLVVIEDGGKQASAIWWEGDALDELRPAIKALRYAVESAKVTGVFLSAEPFWGTPQTGEWDHMALEIPRAMIHHCQLLTPYQKMAEHRENYRTLNIALGEFTVPHLEQALTILQAEALSRSEKFVGVVEWLLKRHADRKRVGPVGRNLIWQAVASAPAGFCTPRSSMVGTLLEDLIAGLDFQEVQRRFNSKMHPLQYQRPQAAPSAGNIRVAEETFNKLGLEPALHRRFATLDEVPLLWAPKASQAAKPVDGIFAHLSPKGQQAPDMKLPAQTMTWVKFRDTVLPTAEAMEFAVPSRGEFTAIVTATHADAPPIMQWDSPEQRNPASWYVYHRGSLASKWGLPGGQYVRVLGITRKPCMWFNPDRFSHLADGLVFLLEGACDSNNDELALFPENLRSDLHAVRSVIEAYSKSRAIDKAPQGVQLASGYQVTKGQPWAIGVRVTTAGKTMYYNLDRWD